MDREWFRRRLARDICADYGISAARVIAVVSLLCHSEAAKASLILSRGYLWESKRPHGQRSRDLTKKSSAFGITNG
jgi:hypothetical protein